VPEATPVLELRGISKGFVGVQALDDVSFALHRGEVHILLGENGAGKSTLMKILCGAYKADAGEFFYEGNAVRIAKPSDAKAYGIAVLVLCVVFSLANENFTSAPRRPDKRR
jgi:ribose transport system ATP-binding protein